jgi:RND family efflux transporter MFP subunit
VLALVGCDRTGPEQAEVIRPVRSIRVGDESPFRGRQFPGRAEPLQFADLSFRVPGNLRELPVRVGQAVASGAVVAQLDRRDFEVRVRAAEASLARAKADLSRSELELTRFTEGFDRGAVSEIELVRVREARNIAAATVEAIEAELQSARDDLTDTTLTAPFAGEVTARYAETYEDVQAKRRVVRIVDDSKIRFTVYIPEQLMTLIATVQEIRCEFDAFPGREIVATIDEIGREADAITRTFPITLVMAQPEGARILAGMTGRAWVERMDAPSGAVDEFDLPPSAIGEQSDGERFVWVVDESRMVVTRRAVRVGTLTPDGVRVQGVKRGEVIATAGAAFLREGQRVRLTDSTPPAPVESAE